jgi:PAS domain S-box-containing protein
LRASVSDSRRRLQSILAGISDCYVAVDRQLRIVALNRQAEEWIGASADKVIGVDFRNLDMITKKPSVTIEPDTRQSFHAALEDAVTRGVHVHKELASVVYEGRWIDVQVNPSKEGAVILFRDITDSKLDQQRLMRSLGLVQSSLDALSARIAILDGSGFIIAVNNTWREFYGKPGQRQAQMDIGANYKESCEIPALREGVIGVVNGKPRFELPYELETAAGQRWYQVAVIPFKQSDFARIVVAHEDVTETVRSRQAATDLRSRLISLQEEERQRIAIELHDSTAQYLVAASLSMVRLRSLTGTVAGASQLCEEIDDLIDEALRELRVFTYLLHPTSLSSDGLSTTLERFISGFRRRSSLEIDLSIDEEIDDLPYELQRTVLRIAQEALANAHRHASAKRVSIGMSLRDAKVLLEVADDGCGMPSASLQELTGGLQLGVGIAGMKARADQYGGTVEFQTTPNGTTVLATIPVPAGGRSGEISIHAALSTSHQRQPRLIPTGKRKPGRAPRLNV